MEIREAKGGSGCPSEAALLPPGGIISPTLLNITLSGLETAIKGVSKKGDKINVVIYADDFVVTGSSKEVLGGENQNHPY